MTVAARMEEVRSDVSELASTAATAGELMQRLCRLLHERMLKYNWVGFYMIEPDAKPPMLALGAFVHGHAADRLATRIGPVGYLAGDLANELPSTLAALGT